MHARSLIACTALKQEQLAEESQDHTDVRDIDVDLFEFKSLLLNKSSHATP